MADGQTPLPRMLCHELAQAIASSDGGRVFRLLARLHRLEAPRGAADRSSAAARRRSTAGDALRIGIWERDPHDGDTFVRVPHRDARLWAAVDRIERKAGPRVLFFGESVARGYFYDPHWNAAGVLRSLLNERVGGDGAEVVDLARSDLGFSSLLPLVESALALRPDACVVFAGNNWSPFSWLGWTEARQIAALLADGGWTPVREWLESVQRGRVEQFAARLGAIARRASVPIIVVVPEFNLVDWEDPDADLPFVSRDALLQWLAARRALERARQAGDHAAAARATEEMLRIDGGTMPVSLRSAAFARARAGAHAEARRLFERARDTAMSLPVRRAPRCFTVTQDTLLEQSTREGLTVVDLRRRFEEAVPGALPDRRLFLDYCHLSAEGLRIAMASVAQHLLPALGAGPASWRELFASTSRPAARVEATAHVLAANHNFNWGQSDEIVAHHCHAALAADPLCADDVERFIDVQTRRAPSLACASFVEMARRSRPSVERYLNPLRSPKRAKGRLIDLMGAALERVRPGAERRIAELRAREHGPIPERVDLLDQYYADGSYTSLERVVQSRIGYHRSFSMTSSFAFTACPTRDLHVQVVYRVPTSAAADDVVVVSINGVPAGELPVRPQWRTRHIRLAATSLRSGVNTLTFRWPLPHGEWRDRLGRLNETIDRNPDEAIEALYPTYGDIGALTLATCETRAPHDAAVTGLSTCQDAAAVPSCATRA